ncbi:MAG: hypothetical protein JETT_2674 [Candidatus Jettenia ecosi]|uniref:Uncharacterized protein n=1 Tax=Candidatus Jettenia ecosi TaxID=2494326 RepID=A0A533Q8W9_9BACT|nr:MAG: hypothetical protein JETT_2674 [Candidatus Jettenia ecosi]
MDISLNTLYQRTFVYYKIHFCHLKFFEHTSYNTYFKMKNMINIEYY